MVSTIDDTASSIDGFIVDETDSLDWLTSRTMDADGPIGYRKFTESVGAVGSHAWLHMQLALTWSRCQLEVAPA